MSDEPSHDRVQNSAKERQSEQADRSEAILDEVGRHLGEVEYPVTGEELATEYATAEIDLPNETESLGSVFDRLTDEEFESAEQAREAIYGEITGEAGDRREANPDRDLEDLDEETQESLSEGGADHL